MARIDRFERFAERRPFDEQSITLRAQELPYIADASVNEGFLQRWRLRMRSRAALAGLDERLLKDVGLSAAQANAESRKPFWKA